MRKGNYIMKEMTYPNGVKYWLIFDVTKSKTHHTHVRHSNKKAAKMIMYRAFTGIIPEYYPHYMIVSINRLWYGKDFKENPRLNNENPLTNDPKLRTAKRSKDKHKSHINIYRNTRR